MSYRFLTIFLFTICFITIAKDTSSIQFSISPWGFLTLGRVEKTQREAAASADADFNDFWISDFDAGIKSIVKIGKYGKTRFNFGFTTGFYICPSKSEIEKMQRSFKPYLLDAALEHTFIFNDHTIFTELGFFPFKYNPQVRNLGEYLFRSNSYPTVIYTNFDIPNEKLVGFHGKYEYNISEFNRIQADILFTTEHKIFPLHDFSLSYIISGNFLNFVNFGLGISHSHLISLDEYYTTPAKDTEEYPKALPSYNNVGFKDSLGNTTDYTFKNTKAMGRITLDPKAFFDFSFFGSEDLKLYGEANLLGIKNFKGWYENRKNRIVYTMGFNFPAFKILDVFAIEGEYWENPYWNSFQNIWKNGYPTPFIGNDAQAPNYYRFSDPSDTNYVYKPVTGKNWKWSIYASKTIFDRLSFVCQFSSDHTMRDKYLYPTKRYTELVPRTKDWYWMTKIKYCY